MRFHSLWVKYTREKPQFNKKGQFTLVNFALFWNIATKLYLSL